MPGKGEREAKVEEELYRLLKNVLEKNHYELEGVRFGDVEPQLKVNGGRADLVVTLPGGRHLWVIECKRKVPVGKTIREIREFDPMGSKVIDQALTYSARLGTDFVATTNGRTLALFSAPERGKPFRLDINRVAIKEEPLREEVAEDLLRTVAKLHQGIPVSKVGIDWLFITRLRSFVKFLGEQLAPVVISLKGNAKFKKKFEAFTAETGKGDPPQIALETAYLLMNKIVFYSILETHYGLPVLETPDTKDGAKYSRSLTTQFHKAMDVTKDFEPIFLTPFFDNIPLPSADYVLEEVSAFIEEMAKYSLEQIGSDVVGYIYQELIPGEERHKLGQFYTPPKLAELITKWAIRSARDRVLDPAVGSGTFLVKAYRRLRDFPGGGRSHEDTLRQLFAVDINPFPAHLTAINLAMRDVTHPFSEMNVIVEDFFRVAPNQTALAPYAIRTPKGEVRRAITIPVVDALVANPPYTRWTELSELGRGAVTNAVGRVLKTYKLSPGSVRSEPAAYMHFIMHGADFLKPNARMGMVISNSWLQADYGLRFGRYLKDQFAIRGVIDFSFKLFDLPLVATLVILLEKPDSDEARKTNETVFIYVDRDVTVDALLQTINTPSLAPTGLYVKTVHQEELPTEKKWLGVFFDAQQVETKLLETGNCIRAGDLFDICRGNTEWALWAISHGSRADLGANPFFYLSRSGVREWGLEKYAVPAAPGARLVKNFRYTRADWRKAERDDKPAYLFLCSGRKGELKGQGAAAYIKWGETGCKTKFGKTCNKSDACIIRDQNPAVFRGWYDLGGIMPSPIFATYYAQYKTRFIAADFALALDPDFIAFIPKAPIRLTHFQRDALLAYLNSSFVHLYLEANGRATGGGMLSLEFSHAAKLPVLDVRKLGKPHLERLAALFDDLEKTARKVGGADDKAKLEALDPVIEEVDTMISSILGLSNDFLQSVRNRIKILQNRRISRTGRAESGRVQGEEELDELPQRPRKEKRKAMPTPAHTLDEFGG